MGTTAYLYDADGCDREVELNEELLAGLDERSLLWIDSDDREDEALLGVAALIGVSPDCLRGAAGARPPTLDNYGDHFHFRVNAAPQHHENLPDGERPDVPPTPAGGVEMLSTP